MSKLEELKQRLFPEGKEGIADFKFTRGTNPNATVEEVAGAILDSLDAIERGDYEVVDLEIEDDGDTITKEKGHAQET